MPPGPFPRSEEFQEMFDKAKTFTEDLLKENERLRYKIAALESRSESGADAGDANAQLVEALQAKIKSLSDEKGQLLQRFNEVEEENKDFATRYLEIEEQNNNLANLYVASYQLHSTLDLKEVISIVMEIIINLVGAEQFGIMLIDDKTNELMVIASEGFEDPKEEMQRVQVGDGIIGTVAKTGEPFYINQDPDQQDVDFLHPIACIPLKIREHVIGVIPIVKLLVQKEAFTSVDYELFTLLAGQAATAIFSAKLYSQSERKLSTLQGFLDLLTAGAS